MNRKLSLVILLGLFCITTAPAEPVSAPRLPAAPQSAVAAQPTSEPRILTDVVYGHAGGEDLKLDLALPLGEGPFPLIVCIHGGSWTTGSKALHGREIRQFAANGYAAASIDYRFMPAYRFPAQIEDVKCAVRYLRAHAKEYRIDPERVGAWGFSAGAHLTLLLGLSGGAADLEGDGGNPDASSRVQAAVGMCGGTDFRLAKEPEADDLFMNLLGTTDRTVPIFAAVSPVTYVDPTDPPILTFYGGRDVAVPLIHGETLRTALNAAKVPNQMVTVENGGHGWGGEDRIRTDRQTLEFFDKTLKVPRSADYVILPQPAPTPRAKRAPK